MKGKFILLGCLLAVLFLAPTVAFSQEQGPQPQGQPQPQGDASITATVGNKISYQGLLKEGGNPVTGSRDMIFRLYSNSACTTQVGSDITKSGVQVANGLFKVDLEVIHNLFNGQALWLKAWVGSTDLGMCQEILPVPYALSLRPGAEVTGNSSDPILRVTNRGNGTGIYGFSYDGYAGVYGASDLHYGVWGEGHYGVLGQTYDASGQGVVGRAFSNSGTTYGVYGKSQSPDGYGGYFENTALTGPAYGVYSKSDKGTGIYGEGEDYGVSGYASSATGTTWGVLGSSNSAAGYGVYGLALQGSGATTGVYGESRSPDGFGGFFININSSGLLLAANDVASFTDDLEFKVTNDGEVYADGTFHGGGADFAELLPAVEALEPGDVLVIGLDGKLARSSQPYATNVVGVYSTSPGFLGGSSDDDDQTGKVPLAVVGVVPVKASAENGAIQPGDLLVASSTPGYAMKAEANPPVGSVIGKALEGLEEGSAVIKMLVMIQ